MSDATKVANVKHELALLEKTWKDSGAAAVDLGAEEANLTRVNEALWVIEDDIRDEERASASARSSSSWRAPCTSPTTNAPPSRSASTPCSARPSSKRNRTSPTSRCAGQVTSRDAHDDRRGSPVAAAPPQLARARAPRRLFAADAAAGLKSMTGDVKPIGRAEYLARIEKARALMAQARHRRAAHRARRFAGVFHRRAVVAQRAAHRRRDAARRRHRHRHAAFRRALGARKPARFRPTCACGTRTRIRSSPSPASCAIARSRRRSASRKPCATSPSTGCGARCRACEIVNGAAVVRGCRMVKSPAELALMQKASDITIAAYRHVWPRIKARHDARTTSAP